MKLIDHIDKIEAMQQIRLTDGNYAEYEDGDLYIKAPFICRGDIPKLAAFLNKLISEVE